MLNQWTGHMGVEMIRAFFISFLLGLAVISVVQDLMYDPQPTEQAIENIHRLGRCVNVAPNKISGNRAAHL